MKTQNKFIIIAMLTIFASGIASAQTVAAQIQSAAASSDATGSQPKFGDMSIPDRNAMLMEISKQDFPVIMQAFIDAGRVEHDPGKQGMIWRVLAGAMRQKTPPPDFFARMKAFIADNSNSIQEREQMIAALGVAATKESADVLIYEAMTLKDKNLRDEAIGDVGELGGTSDNVNLAPALDKLWNESKDRQMLMSASMSMAEIGAPSSVNLLLSAALASNDTDRKTLAKEALQEVILKNAVPPLGAALANQHPTSPQAILAFNTLTQIPDPTAAQALIAWLQTADDSAAPLALNWIAHAKHDSQLKAATAALDPKVRFSSEANREALRVGLEAYKNSNIDVIHQGNRKQ